MKVGLSPVVKISKIINMDNVHSSFNNKGLSPRDLIFSASLMMLRHGWYSHAYTVLKNSSLIFQACYLKSTFTLPFLFLVVFKAVSFSQIGKPINKIHRSWIFYAKHFSCQHMQWDYMYKEVNWHIKAMDR